MFTSLTAKCQFLDANDIYKSNLLYNWGKPAKVILDFASDATKKSKSKIRLTAEYELLPERTTDFLFDFKLANNKQDADIVVQKLIYPDSVVLIGKESRIIRKKRVVFTYVFKNLPNKLEFLNIRAFDANGQIGKLYLYPDDKKVYVQNMGIDFRAVAVYNKHDFIIDYVIDLSKSSKSRSVVAAINGFKQPIKHGAIDVKTMEVLLPFEYSSTQIHKNEAGKSFIAAMKNTESALFDSTATNLTGFILKGEVRSVHNDQTIQLKKSSDNNPMIVNFKGAVICETFGEFAFGELIPMKYGFYCIANLIGTCDGLVTPKGVATTVYGFIQMKPQKAIDYVIEELDQDGCFRFETDLNWGWKDAIVNLKGELYDDTENELCAWCFYRDGLITVQNRKTGLYGFMDVNFKLVLPCVYESNSYGSPPYFEEGKADVMVNGESYFIDKKGNRVNK
jgi:hypothetical protein